MTALRPLQARAHRALQQEFAAGHRRILLVAPTGFGKTVLLSFIVASHLARAGELGRVVIVVHRTELIDQTVRKLRAAGLTHLGIIAAGDTGDRTAPVQVASVQTLLARGELPPATMVVLDEAHHYVADRWKDIADHYADAITLGFTATPERGDGTPLGDIFETLVVAAQAHELMACGDLVPCDVVAPPKKTRSLSMDPVEAHRKYAEGRPAVVFARGVKEGRELTDAFTAAGLPAGFVDGATAPDERRATLQRFERGELAVLVNVFVLCEGWDCPPAAVCILARGCNSVATYLQMIGRVLRPSPATGKARALLIDLRGAVFTHGLPDEGRVFSLEGKPISSGDAPVKTCLSCGHVCPIALLVCPTCSEAFAVRDNDACGLRRIGVADRERGFFVDSLEKARERGYKPGWAARRFVEKFGRFPSKLWRELVAPKAEAQAMPAWSAQGAA